MKRAAYAWLLLAGLASACTGDLDPQWQLDHTRIIAVRATPPSIPAGATSTIDGLLGTKGAMTSVAPPDAATVTSPASLAGALSLSNGAWTVTAPDEATLDEVRQQQGIAAGAPVPLEIGVAYDGESLLATKVVMLGASADNPTLPAITINGAPPPPAGSEITIMGNDIKNPVSIAADNTIDDVEWLTSCGTMHDFDLPDAYVRIEKDDPTTGEFGVVLRDPMGGVAWELWPIMSIDNAPAAN
jgi:hypothetical protein